MSHHTGRVSANINRLVPVFKLTLYSKNGIGMKAIEMKANVLLAHPTPSFEYMAEAKSGNLILSQLLSKGSRIIAVSCLPSTEAGPHKVVASQHTGRIFGICVWQVVQDGVEQQESTNREPSRADDGHDPVDRWASTPTEPEETAITSQSCSLGSVDDH